jgi:hypothetical protein
MRDGSPPRPGCVSGGGGRVPAGGAGKLETRGSAAAGTPGGGGIRLVEIARGDERLGVTGAATPSNVDFPGAAFMLAEPVAG